MKIADLNLSALPGIPERASELNRTQRMLQDILGQLENASGRDAFLLGVLAHKGAEKLDIAVARYRATLN